MIVGDKDDPMYGRREICFTVLVIASILSAKS